MNLAPDKALELEQALNFLGSWLALGVIGGFIGAFVPIVAWEFGKDVGIKVKNKIKRMREHL